MHILLIHQAFVSLNEAGGTRHIEIARNLVKRGHRVTIIASPISYLTGKSSTVNNVYAQNESIPGITIIRSYTYPALHKSFFHRLISFFSFMLSSFFNGLKVRKVDIIWGTSPPIFQGFTAWLLSTVKRIPFLFEVRDLWPEFAVSVGVLRNPWLIKASEWLERFLYKKAKVVVVNSPGFINHVTSKGAKSVELVTNGVDPEMFSKQSDKEQNFRKEQGFINKFIVIYAGAHGVSNDLGVVLQCAQILKVNPEIHFVFLGDGKDKPILMEQASKMKLSNVSFFPPVPKNEMAQILSDSDACIAILKPLDCYKTTYPNKVFDYMAAGKPVILAIDGVIKEVVEQAKCGIAVPPGDARKMSEAILELYNDRRNAFEMGKAGAKYVAKHFNREGLSERIAEIFERTGKGKAA